MRMANLIESIERLRINGPTRIALGTEKKHYQIRLITLVGKEYILFAGDGIELHTYVKREVPSTLIAKEFVEAVGKNDVEIRQLQFFSSLLYA